MKPQAIVGVVLIVVGILILVFQEISFTKNAAVPVPAKSVERDPNPETVPVPQIIGAVSLAGGIFLAVLGSRK